MALRIKWHQFSSVQFNSVAQSCLTLCDRVDCSTAGFPVHHQLPEFTQTHAHQVGDAIQPSHPLSSPSSTAFNLSQYQGLFQWVGSSHQVAKGLEFQLQHQSLSLHLFKTLKNNLKPCDKENFRVLWLHCLFVCFSYQMFKEKIRLIYQALISVLLQEYKHTGRLQIGIFITVDRNPQNVWENWFLLFITKSHIITKFSLRSPKFKIQTLS